MVFNAANCSTTAMPSLEEMMAEWDRFTLENIGTAAVRIEFRSDAQLRMFSELVGLLGKGKTPAEEAVPPGFRSLHGIPLVVNPEYHGRMPRVIRRLV